ncbi:MAG: hypothetical protein PHU63_02535 [Candidatus ainarchaeum sp.]|nr:hypothetical protein [Candidatus ainarchaeum sp.]
MLLRNINRAIKEYTKKPILFAWTVIISIILNFIAIGAVAGAFLVVYYALAIMEMGDVPLLIYSLISVLFITYLVIMNGLKGALINSLKGITKKQQPSITYFFKYAIQRGSVFFSITLLKLVFSAIFIIPIYLLYQNVLLPMEIPHLELIFSIVVAGIVFIIEFPFSYTYISAAVNEYGVINSLRASLRFLRKRGLSAFGIYIVYAIVWTTLFVPLLNIVSILVLYPIVYTAMILLYEGNK